MKKTIKQDKKLYSSLSLFAILLQVLPRIGSKFIHISVRKCPGTLQLSRSTNFWRIMSYCPPNPTPQVES